jgi:diguanylate cyclase (GGDEF)-like protein
MDEVATAVEPIVAAEPSGARLGQVAELARSLATAQRTADVVEAGALAVWDALDAGSVSVARLDAGHGAVRILHHVGDLGPLTPPVPDSESYLLGQYSFLRALAEGGGPLRYEAGQADADPAQDALLTRAGRGSSLAVPIAVGGRVWGGLYVTRTRGHEAFSDGAVELATVLAAVVGAAIAQVERVQTLALLAMTDPMTGLSNRRGADEALEAALAAHREAGEPVVVVLCDVDGLKRVNDTFGHSAGDLVLTRVSALLSVASSDLRGSTAARVGGDEFCLVVAGLSLKRVIRAVQALSEAARLLPFGAGVSCGVASAEACAAIGEQVTAKQLFRLADAAQYRAKRTGGVRVAVIGAEDIAVLGADEIAVPDPVPGYPDGPGSPNSTARPGHAETLGDGIAAIVAGLALAPGRSPLHRLVVVAETAAAHWRTAGWAVSTLDPGAIELVTRATAMARGGTDCFVAHKLSQVGFSFAVSACSLTAAAVRGDCFHVELADADAPPAALAVLAAAGYRAMIGAGATDAAGTGWFLELYTDAASALSVDGGEGAVAAALRALVALALHPDTPA